MPHAYTKDQLVEKPSLGLFAELGYLLPRLLSGQVELTRKEN